MKIPCLALVFALCACAPFPRDAAGTTERIERTSIMRVGIVSGTSEWSEAAAIAHQLASAHGAIIKTKPGPAARLLKDLDEGRIDLLIGEFGRSGPIAKETSLSEAIGQPEPKDGNLPVVRLARKQGENSLILASDRLALE